MAATFELEVATPDRLLVKDQVTDAHIPGLGGYLGVRGYKHHTGSRNVAIKYISFILLQFANPLLQCLRSIIKGTTPMLNGIIPASWSGPLHAVLRIVAGLLLLEHGTSKYFVACEQFNFQA